MRDGNKPQTIYLIDADRTRARPFKRPRKHTPGCGARRGDTPDSGSCKFFLQFFLQAFLGVSQQSGETIWIQRINTSEGFGRMSFMKMNDLGLGPEGTSHKSPARSAGIGSKGRSRPDGTVQQESRHSTGCCLVCDPGSRSHDEASLHDAGPSSPARTRHCVPGCYKSSRWDDGISPPTAWAPSQPALAVSREVYFCHVSF